MRKFIFLMILIFNTDVFCDILIPMDRDQYDHLKAYGVVFNYLKENGGKVKWMLNYQSGSFILPDSDLVEELCKSRGIVYNRISDRQVQAIENTIKNSNMEIVFLEKAPRIAVFTPLIHGHDEVIADEPWDDAVLLVLKYAEIGFDKIYIEDILDGKLSEYEWIHLHHEDFTGQYGKFYATFKTAKWYIDHKEWLENIATKRGFISVAQMMKRVALNIAKFTSDGGFLFAMCSATDTIDIALATLNTDIVPPEFDGTPIDPDYRNKLDFKNTFAFTDFNIITDPNIYEFSDIDISNYSATPQSGTEDFFLFEFSAKQDPIPTMLTQNHQRLIRGFMGQTSTFDIKAIKDSVVITGYLKDMKRAKYIYGGYGKGFFTFYAGHDPEDFAHRVGDPPTDVSKHKNSPGYRLILNNVLFPAMQKKRMKT